MKFGGEAFALASLLLLATAAATVQAESLPDPTRPPDAIQSAGPGKGEPTAPAGLQSIIRNHRGRPAAIINGEYVVLGGKVGDARLVKIGEDSVTLRSSAGTEILKLMPGIEKTPSGIEEKGARAGTSGKKGRP